MVHQHMTQIQLHGETTTLSNTNSKPSSKIDVVGLAVFKGDVLVRRTYLNGNTMSSNYNKQT